MREEIMKMKGWTVGEYCYLDKKEVLEIIDGHAKKHDYFPKKKEERFKIYTHVDVEDKLSVFDEEKERFFAEGLGLEEAQKMCNMLNANEENLIF